MNQHIYAGIAYEVNRKGTIKSFVVKVKVAGQIAERHAFFFKGLDDAEAELGSANRKLDELALMYRIEQVDRPTLHTLLENPIIAGAVTDAALNRYTLKEIINQSDSDLVQEMMATCIASLGLTLTIEALQTLITKAQAESDAMAAREVIIDQANIKIARAIMDARREGVFIAPPSKEVESLLLVLEKELADVEALNHV